MKLDKTVLPRSLDNYLRSENYDSGSVPTDISATRLKDSPRVNRLFKEHASQITIDYTKRGFAKLGEAWHDYMYKYAPEDWVCEERFYAQIDGRIISGAIDAIEPTATGVNIWDYKLMTSYKAQTELKEFEAQLNIYAFLLRQNDMNPEGLYISGIIRDWSDKKVGGNYPDTMFPVFELPMWKPEEVEEYVRERLALHFAEELPLCTDEERWMSPPRFAVVSQKTGKTLRLFDSEQQAIDYQTKTPVTIERRESEPIRCQRFCEVASFCDQYQSELFTKEILSDGK
jgi:hypothetical protein